MRAVTLSNPEVIKFLTNEVVPYWESVGPVPKVTIELGDGRVIKRTLGGNVVTYLLSSEGNVYDAFPGVYTPEHYLSEILNTMEAIKSDSDILSWHRQELAAAAKTEEMRMTMSKAVVESPLLRALGGSEPSNKTNDASTAFQKYTARLQDISKQAATVAELRSSVLNNVQSNDPNEIGRAAVAIDSRNNLKLIRPAVHLLFSSYKKLPSVQQCRDQIYEDILHIPIHDPYLGLADAIVPGSPIQ
jgi:hypothetical protein